MQLSRRHFLGTAVAAAAGVTAGCIANRVAVSLPSTPVPEPGPAADSTDLAEGAPVLRSPLLVEAMAALDAHGIAARDKLALVDFSRPSSEPRLHLVDIATGQIERSWLVAHGKGSDPSATGMLQQFSNEPGSNASSSGAFLTADRYLGQHGNSQRLIGLDASNDMALDRAIVIHGAAYVDPALVSSQGRIGRSQGCFAVEESQVSAVMDALGPGRLIYAGKLA
ncbi:MAG: murein L,D-transpeptidase catalytic domain family protein [Croceibacterium sp.]